MQGDTVSYILDLAEAALRAPQLETALEKDSSYLLRHQVCLLATHCLRHRRIVLDAGAHAHSESLISHPAHHPLGRRFSLALDAAHYGLIADSAEGRALGRALREVGGELLRDVGHDVDRDSQLKNHSSLLPRIFTDSSAMIADLRGQSHRTAKNPACRCFIDPGTLHLPMADGGREHRQAEQKCV